MTAVGVEPDLVTRVADATFDNPVLIASGCGGSGRELHRFGGLSGIGGFVTPTVRRDPTPGRDAPRVLETPSGLLTATGLPGPGIDAFLARDLPWLLQHDVRPIVSIAGVSLGEYAELARRVGHAPGVAAVEMLLTWTGSDTAATFGADPVQAARAVSVVRRDVPRGLPVLVKLAPGGGGLLDLARAVVEAGADGLVLAGAPAGLALDPATLRPSLADGGLSGPAIRAIALATVWEVAARLPDVPLIGGGGVSSGQEALEMIAAGASAVQAGTAVLHDPVAACAIVAELRAAMLGHGFARMSEALRAAHRE
jgi:dihydroorotate dehydrogenase (NAD+) catalytic subunit